MEGPSSLLVDSQPPARSPTPPSFPKSHKSLAANLDDAYADFSATLQFRNRFYKWSVVCAPVVLAGAGMVVLDVII